LQVITLAGDILPEILAIPPQFLADLISLEIENRPFSMGLTTIDFIEGALQANP
jgi:hypothetical protein